MNREQKRAMQRAGELNEDGTQAAPTRDRGAPAKRVKEERTRPGQFVKEVRAELRKVTWPTRPEVVRLSTIVLVALLVFAVFVFAVDTGFAEVFRWLLSTGRESAGGAVATAAAAVGNPI